MIDFLNSFFLSPTWPKLVVSLFLWAYYLHMITRYRIPQGGTLSLIPVILFVRDLLEFAFSLTSVLFISDILILLIYLSWAYHYFPNRIGIVFSYLVGIGAVISCAVLPVLRPEWQWLDFFFHVFITGGFLYWVSQFFQVSANKTEEAGFIMWFDTEQRCESSANKIEGADFIIENRTSFCIFVVGARILVFAAGFSTNTIAVGYALLLSASYVFHIYFLYRYQVYFEALDDSSRRSTRQTFNFLQTIGSAMKERSEIERVLDLSVKSIVENTSASSGAIFLIDEYDDVLTLKARQGYFPPPFPVPRTVRNKIGGVEKYLESAKIKLGETIFGEVAQSGESRYIRRVAEDPRMEQNTRRDELSMSSIIVIPFIVLQRVFGVLGLVKRDEGDFFSQNDFDQAKLFAGYVSLILENLFTYIELLEKQEIEREVGIAADIQAKLLPKQLPKIKNAGVSAYSVPARGVSGDYYDIIPLREGKFAMVICDVAGKGVPASLVMVMIRTIIHLIASSSRSTAQIVSWINKGIAGKIDIDRFATLSFFTFDPATGVLQYSNAAHHPAMIYRAAAGSVEQLDTDGLPIGIEREARYSQRETRLANGDIIMMYTDGVVEAMDSRGRQYEDERLKSIFVDNASLGAEDLLKVIQTDIDAFVGNAKQHDDQTLMLMKMGE